jgi:hypothetical protein
MAERWGHRGPTAWCVQNRDGSVAGRVGTPPRTGVHALRVTPAPDADAALSLLRLAADQWQPLLRRFAPALVVASVEESPAGPAVCQVQPSVVRVRVPLRRGGALLPPSAVLQHLAHATGVVLVGEQGAALFAARAFAALRLAACPTALRCAPRQPPSARPTGTCRPSPSDGSPGSSLLPGPGPGPVAVATS